MSSAEQAIIAVLVATPVLVVLYLYGRWSRNELKWPRDAIVVAGSVAWGLFLAAVFGGPPIVILFVPPAVFLAGGIHLLRTQSTGTMRLTGQLAIGLGVIGLVGGIIRLAFM